MKLSYPVISLQTAIFYLKKLRQSLDGEYFSRDQAFSEMKISDNSGYSNNIFSALVQYGLIQKPTAYYEITVEGKKLLKDENNIDYLKGAFFKPELFRELILTAGVRLLNDSDKETLVHKYEVAISQLESVIKVYNENMIMVSPHLKPSEDLKTILTQDSSNVLIMFESGVQVKVPKKVIFDAVMKDLNSLK